MTALPLAGSQTTFSSGRLVAVSVVSLTVTIRTTLRLSDAFGRARYRHLVE